MSFYDDVMRMERARLGEDDGCCVCSGINEKKYADWARNMRQREKVSLQQKAKEGEKNEASLDA